MTPGRERLARLLREGVLTVGAVLGTLVLLVGLAAVTLDVRPLVFRSGSMAPAIDTGALAIARTAPADELEVGDIVSVHTSAGSRVTHRVVDLALHDGVAELHLKGDANEQEDAETYHVAEADRVLFSVPALGYVLEWASGSWGRFVLGLYAAFLCVVLFQRSRSRSSRSTGRRRNDLPEGAAAVDSSRGQVPVATAVLAVATVGLLAVVAGARIAPTAAAFTDSGNLTGTTFGTYTVPTTTLSCSRLTAPNRTQYTWTAVVNATSYTISFTGPTPKTSVTQASTTYIDTAPAASRVASVVANRAFGSVTWTSVASNTVTTTNSNGTCS